LGNTEIPDLIYSPFWMQIIRYSPYSHAEWFALANVNESLPCFSALLMEKVPAIGTWVAARYRFQQEKHRISSFPNAVSEIPPMIPQYSAMQPS
jgi:hypothetical protein